MSAFHRSFHLMMEPLSTLEAEAPEVPNVKRHSLRKSHGVHYTPPELASFVARRSLTTLTRHDYVVLDPACGDGELLLAVAREAERMGLRPPRLVGLDRDADAVARANERLSAVRASDVVIDVGDFLALGAEAAGSAAGLYDLVVSNPPYVRTQVLGAARAQELGRQFGLTGRVDLYHAFVAAMTAKLGDGGVLGLLCSNRFLTTKGGASLRGLLLRNYEVAELWDLGDTKLFDAAVLPAVVVAKRTSKPGPTTGTFVRVYESDAPSADGVESDSLLGALESGIEGSVRLQHRSFDIERGQLAEPSPEKPWQLASAHSSRWLRVVSAHAAGTLGDFGPIRVGVKTTADGVFIRPTWDDLPRDLIPEPELLHPLLTHRVAERWTASSDPDATRWVLYPHETVDGRKRTIDLDRFPNAAAYLEQHRERLEGRAYVTKAGRAWYEIWVPQRPDAWAAPKLVWPDISERPRFFLDSSGAIVNGDCYWLSCAERSDDEIALALAVSNSTFAVQHYDMCCGNRLYSGRRRFITQYVEALPLPEASSAALRDVSSMVAQLRTHAATSDTDARDAVERALDSAVFEMFGLEEGAGKP